MKRSGKIYASLWCVWLVCVIIVSGLNAGMVNPAENAHSSFLKNYSSAETIRRFAEHYGRNESDGQGAEAGRGFVHNSRIVETRLVINSKVREELTLAVRRDVERQLHVFGAVVTSQAAEHDGTLRFGYTTDNVEGSVAVQGPETFDGRGLVGRLGLEPGYEGVKMRVSIDEKWLKRR